LLHLFRDDPLKPVAVRSLDMALGIG
jgi:hypothetical protein